jgi:hypothetical protein
MAAGWLTDAAIALLISCTAQRFHPTWRLHTMVFLCKFALFPLPGVCRIIDRLHAGEQVAAACVVAAA